MIFILLDLSCSAVNKAAGRFNNDKHGSLIACRQALVIKRPNQLLVSIYRVTVLPPA